MFLDLDFFSEHAIYVKVCDLSQTVPKIVQSLVINCKEDLVHSELVVKAMSCFRIFSLTTLNLVPLPTSGNDVFFFFFKSFKHTDFVLTAISEREKSFLKGYLDDICRSHIFLRSPSGISLISQK